MEDILKNEIIRIELAPEKYEKEDLLRVIKQLNEEIESIEFYANLEDDVDRLQDEITNLENDISGLKTENDSLERENDKLEDKVDELEAEIEILTTKKNEKTL